MRPATITTALAIAGAACASAFGCAEDRDVPAGETAAPATRAAPSATARDPGATRVEVVPETTRGPRVSLSVLGRYKDPAFGAAELPALSADGKRVAYTEELLDGGRGNPNLRLVVRELASNRPVNKLEALAPSPRWRPEDEAIVRGRLDAINALLAKDSWEPMTASTFEDDVGPEPVLVIGTLDITIAAGAVVVTRNRARVLSRPLASLIGRNPEPSCEFIPRLVEAYHLESALLVRVAFQGREGCFRESQYHTLVLR